MDIVKIILAIFLPPVAAFLQVGLGMHFLAEHPADASGRLAGGHSRSLAGGQKEIVHFADCLFRRFSE